MSAYREHLPDFKFRGRQRNRQRGVSASTAENLFAASDYAYNGIVDVANDRTVVDQEKVGNPMKALEGFMLINA